MMIKLKIRRKKTFVKTYFTVVYYQPFTLKIVNCNEINFMIIKL